MREGHLLKRAGREFAKNLIWMAVVFGSLAAILVAATDLPLIGAMAFVGVSVAVVAAIVTWLCSGAEPAMRHPSVATTTLARLPTVVIGPVAVGMMLGSGQDSDGGTYKAVCVPVRNDP